MTTRPGSATDLQSPSTHGPLAPGPLPPKSSPGGWHGSSRTLVLYVLLPYLLLVGVKLVLSWPLNCPLKPDELGYLGNARQLATGSGLVDPTGRAPYKVGYSLLLIPAFLFGQDPVGGFKTAQVINAFLLSLVYPAAYFLAGRLRRDLVPLDRMLAALCVGLYPAALLYATTAMSANAFFPAFFFLTLVASAALSGGGWRSWAGLGVAAAYLYTVHERAVGIVVVTLLAGGLHGLSRSPRRKSVLALVAAVPLTLGLMRWLEVPGSRWRTGSKGFQVLANALGDPRALWVTFIGQFWYLGLATLGVLFAGTIFLLLKRGRLATDPALRGGSGEKQGSTPRLFWLLLYGSAASVFSLSVLFMSQRPNARLTHWIYGRYNEGVLLPVLLVALVALRSVDWRRGRRAFVVSCAGALLLLGALTLALNLAWKPGIGPPFSFSASSVPIYLRSLGWGILRAGASFGFGFAVLAALFSWRWRWGVVGLSLFFTMSTAVSYRDTWVQRYDETEEQRELVRLVRRIAPERKVILRDHQVRPFHFHYYNLSYFLPDYSLERWRGKRLARQAGDLVLSGNRDFGRAVGRTRLAGLENFARRGTSYMQGLWVLPGALQKDLAARGWLLPTGFPRPLPESYLQSELRWLATPPRRLSGGQRGRFEVEVIHRGGGPWPHRGGLRTAQHSVRMLARYFADGATEPSGEQWWDLPRMLYPGESAAMSLGSRADRSLPSGPYRVVLAIAQSIDGRPAAVGGGGLVWELEISE